MTDCEVVSALEVIQMEHAAPDALEHAARVLGAEVIRLRRELAQMRASVDTMTEELARVGL